MEGEKGKGGRQHCHNVQRIYPAYSKIVDKYDCTCRFFFTSHGGMTALFSARQHAVIIYIYIYTYVEVYIYIYIIR